MLLSSANLAQIVPPVGPVGPTAAPVELCVQRGKMWQVGFVIFVVAFSQFVSIARKQSTDSAAHLT